MKKSAWMATAAVVALSLTAGAAGAGTAANPEIADAAGDAYFVNGQGLAPGHEQGPDAGPASIGSADIRAVWFETTYVKEKVRDAEGKIVAVKHTPTGLKVNVKTTAPASPSFGPTVVFRVPVVAGTCNAVLEGWINGPLSQPSSGPIDVAQRANVKLVSGCPVFGSSIVTSNLFKLTFAGGVMTIEYPFAELAARLVGQINAGATLAPAASGASVSTVSTILPTSTVSPAGVMIDQTVPARAFAISSDVPSDIDCVATPDHAECES